MIRPFPELIQSLRHRLEKPLPGPPAQYRMAPFGRQERVNTAQLQGDFRPSAVLILLYPNPEPHFVLTLRHQYGGMHSGQVSLPGGRLEPEDIDLKHTALRETEEEVGVSQSEVEVIGRLTTLPIPVSRFEVHPFVGALSSPPVFTPEPKEVARIIETPLPLLTDPATRQQTMMDLMKYKNVQVPYFSLDGETVWGATAMILSEFVEILKGDELDV